MMSENPFKIIEPTEEPPIHLKKDVMGSVKTIILILRFVQLFVGDYASLFVHLFKTGDNDHKQ